MDAVVTELNEEAEEMKKMKKDKMKERNEGKQVSDHTDLQCTQPGCTSAAQNKADLVNYQRQKHGAAAQEILFCCHCHQNFKEHSRELRSRNSEVW